MTQIVEDYCDFEIAKLLKEKGFDVPCMGRYSVRSKEFHLDCTKLCNNGGLFEYAAPTLQMTMKWLREVHHIHIRLINSSDESYRYEIYPREGKYRSSCFSDGCYYENYEEACEVAIKYCLENLI